MYAQSARVCTYHEKILLTFSVICDDAKRSLDCVLLISGPGRLDNIISTVLCWIIHRNRPNGREHVQRARQCIIFICVRTTQIKYIIIFPAQARVPRCVAASRQWYLFLLFTCPIIYIKLATCAQGLFFFFYSPYRK